MSEGTPALAHLVRERIPHQVHRYEIAESSGAAQARGTRVHYGAAAASALGIPQHLMFKTLVVALEPPVAARGGRPDAYGIALLSVDRDASLKRVARAFGARRAALVEAVDVTKVTGYVVGGVSPFGTTRRLPVVIDEPIRSLQRVYLSAGRRGVSVELAAADLVRELGAQVAPISGAE